MADYGRNRRRDASLNIDCFSANKRCVCFSSFVGFFDFSPPVASRHCGANHAILQACATGL